MTGTLVGCNSQTGPNGELSDPTIHSDILAQYNIFYEKWANLKHTLYEQKRKLHSYKSWELSSTDQTDFKTAIQNFDILTAFFCMF